jgi:hypothetical protein
LQLVTVLQRVNDTVKELPAIRDTAHKVTTIFGELPNTAAQVSSLHGELPAISGKITAIYDDMPAVANKVTVIHDALPAIRDALKRLAVRVTSPGGQCHITDSFKSYVNKLISLNRLLRCQPTVNPFFLLTEMGTLLVVRKSSARSIKCSLIPAPSDDLPW